MSDLKKYAAIFALVASSAITTGCSSTSNAPNYNGSGSVMGMTHAGTPQNTATHKKANTDGLWIYRNGFNLEARKCSTPDQWTNVQTPNGGRLNAYCFDEKTVSNLEKSDLITGLAIQKRGVNGSQFIKNAFMRQAYIGVQQRGANTNSRIRIGANGREGVNVVSSLVDTGQYAKTCFEKFAYSPDTKLGNSLPKTARELGTFENCQKELKWATAAYYMRDVKINVNKNFNIRLN
tara:strand:+ start:55441 stop:56145 length:705 start_codon:yes stop_codon:yes gene_type:complete